MITCIVGKSLLTLGSCHVYIQAVQRSIHYHQVYSIDQDIHHHLDHM